MSQTKDLQTCYAIDDLEAVKELVDQLSKMVKAAEATPKFIIPLTRAMNTLIGDAAECYMVREIHRMTEEIQMGRDIQS